MNNKFTKFVASPVSRPRFKPPVPTFQTLVKPAKKEVLKNSLSTLTKPLESTKIESKILKKASDKKLVAKIQYPLKSKLIKYGTYTLIGLASLFLLSKVFNSSTKKTNKKIF